jgi:hypothetical protein
MNGIQTIQSALGSTQWLLNEFVKDLSDEDLVVRPVAKANHLAWQLGHIIQGEVMMVNSQLPNAGYPALPGTWGDLYGGKGADKDGQEHFAKKADYLSLFNDVHKNTIAAVGRLTDSDLDKPTQGQMAPFAPKLGNFFILVSNHTLMHVGQFTVLRRKLGKPVLF